jgi:GNAT superfamily N-acetyltransferase
MTERDGVAMEIDWSTGPRAEIRHLFELAEDSQIQLDRYLDLGRVLIARRDARTIGHLQLIPGTQDNEIEVKSLAVVPEERGTGVGRTLVRAAVQRCTSEGWSRLLVATATADIGNLRFYQRVGFRMLSVERDAFTPATGYPDPIVIDGIPLRDRVWLSQDLPPGR